jgi:Mn2+/Fe2+ NRAMP family transporter
MFERSRGLRETMVRALAKVGLVWVLAVLGAVFMAMSSQGHRPDGGDALSSARAATHASTFSVSPGEAPSTAGLVLALVILGAGVTVLAAGAAHGDHATRSTDRSATPLPDLTPDLPLALGLGLGSTTA